MRKRQTVQQRVLARAVRNEETGCFEMFGANERGRSRIGVNKKVMNTARALWIEVHGPLPQHLFVCHHCDNMRCVEITHLFVGTQKDNVNDMLRKGREAIPKTDSAKIKRLIKELTIRMYKLGWLYRKSLPKDLVRQLTAKS